MAKHATEIGALDTDLSSDGEDLMQEEIDQILKEAEYRLLAQEKNRNSELSAGRPTKLDVGGLVRPYVGIVGEIAQVDAGRLLDKTDRDLSEKPRKVEDPVTVRQRLLTEKKTSAGSDWFNLPRTDLTPELKRDLQLLKMRGVLDPKRHYKKENGKMKAPEFSQMGTIVEGPTEFFSGRILNRDRKRTFVEEILAAEAETGRFRKKYNEVQAAKTSGKKAFYKELKAKRQKARKS